jgi:hypothetical protein
LMVKSVREIEYVGKINSAGKKNIVPAGDE